MGRFDILTMADDEREALAERSVQPELTNRRGQIISNPRVLLTEAGPSPAPVGTQLNAPLSEQERLASMEPPYQDPQDPNRYVFAVFSNDDEDEVTVAITPIFYWEGERAQSDWELTIDHLLPDYLRDQVMESTFRASGVSATQIVQDMVALGFNHNPEFQQFFTGEG